MYSKYIFLHLSKKCMKRLVIIDNEDSFIYNIAHKIKEVNSFISIEIIKQEEATSSQIEQFDYIILSPGPGLPQESNGMMNLISEFYTKKKILGVCLGHQAINLFFGGRLKKMPKICHGQKTQIFTSTEPYFATLYNSWCIDEDYLPDCLEVTARDNNYNIMAIRHKSLPILGVQFHPESIASDCHKIIFEPFISL